MDIVASAWGIVGELVQGPLQWGDWLGGIHDLEARRGFRFRPGAGRALGRMSGTMWYGIFGGVIALLGLVGALFPKALIKPSEGENFTAMTLLLVLGHVFTRLLPEKIRSVGVRVFGVIALVGGGAMIASAMNAEAESDAELEELTALVQQAAQTAERAPAHAEAVVAGLRAAKPEWLVESPDPFTVHIVERNYLVRAEHDLLAPLEDDDPVEKTVAAIVEATPQLFKDEYDSLRETGQLEKVVFQRRVQYNIPDPRGAVAELSRPSAPPPPPASAPRPVPTLADADVLIKQAASLWQAGDVRGSLQAAQQARAIRAHYLGAGDARTIEVDRMIAAAQAALAK